MPNNKPHMKILDRWYTVGERIDGRVLDACPPNGRVLEVHGVVTKTFETTNFGWVAIKQDSGKTVFIRE